MDDNLLNLILAICAVAAAIYLFIKITIKSRKYGGSRVTNLDASTYEFLLNKGKRKAIDKVTKLKADKKQRENKSHIQPKK